MEGAPHLNSNKDMEREIKTQQQKILLPMQTQDTADELTGSILHI